MAYEDKTLNELMAEIRKQRRQPAEKKPWEDDDFFRDPGYPELEEEPQPIDIDACIADVMEDLAPYRLAEADLQTVREFLTFRLQTRQVWDDEPEARRGSYNLIVCGEEQENIRHFADILSRALAIPAEQVIKRSESEMIQLVAAGESPRSSRPLFPRRMQLLLIDDCREAPVLDVNGGAAARDASKKAISAYKTMWDTVFAHLKKNPETVLIVGSDAEVYRNTLRPFSALSQRVCSHHIQLPVRTEADLVEECLAELRKSAFTLDEGFETALAEYFRSAYRTAELRNREFISHLIGQIYSRYYSCRRETRVLTADCIPVYDPTAQSAAYILGQLEQLVGLEEVKREFRNIYKMQMAGLANPENTHYHMLFAGNPGTGKTTVAQMAADLFFRMGVIKTNKLVTVKPSDLISEWIGGTGTKAMEVIRRAYNGVLFIDEAYGIANMDRGEELLNVLLQEMEMNAGKLIVILAGYTDEMRELLKANPGLGSRIGQEIHFRDYTQEELAQIFLQMAKKAGFSLDPTARDELDDYISALMTREFFGNAREVRNLLQDLQEVWAEDFYTAVTQNGADAADVKRVFLPHHFEKIMPPKKEVSINDLIGLEALKKKLEEFKRQAMYKKYLKEKGFMNLTDFSMHMVFTGNPGTGKTTVARLIADDLYSIGMLRTNRLVVAERKDLVGIRGDTAQKTADVIKKAVGGVLFVDEAYSLSGDRYGGDDCIEVLLTAMEEHKGDTVFIFAGYVREMREFLASNPGIQSRIGYTFHFDDYTTEELTQIYADKMKKMGFDVSAGALNRVREIMEYFRDVKNFGNGRFVNHVIHQTISQRASRDFTKRYRNIRSQDIPTIKMLIETAPNSMQLYDPGSISPEQHRRTAIHELGHAFAMMEQDSGNMPEMISIRNQAGSYGRVRLVTGPVPQTERRLFEDVVTLLSGKNAEKLIFGQHATGCAQDYARAKQLAKDMIEHFAMDSYGKTEEEILETADKRSMEIMTANKSRMEDVCPKLLERKELTGMEFWILLEKL